MCNAANKYDLIWFDFALLTVFTSVYYFRGALFAMYIIAGRLRNCSIWMEQNILHDILPNNNGKHVMLMQ